MPRVQQNFSEFFSSTILALASRFLRVGGLKRRFGRKKVQEMDFCQNCSHISGPPSARQYGTVRQGNLSFGRFLLTLSGIKRSQVMCLENCSLLTSWLRARNVETVLTEIHFQYFFRPNLFLSPPTLRKQLARAKIVDEKNSDKFCCSCDQISQQKLIPMPLRDLFT